MPKDKPSFAARLARTAREWRAVLTLLAGELATLEAQPIAERDPARERMLWLHLEGQLCDYRQLAALTRPPRLLDPEGLVELVTLRRRAVRLFFVHR